MNRARFYAGAAVLAAACALPSAANAQACALLGSPQPFPPCIVLDASKIATTVQDIGLKTQQISSLVEQAKEYTTIQGVLGKLKERGVCTFKSRIPVAPLAAQGNDFQSSAQRAIDTSPSLVGATGDANTAALATSRVQVRGAAGDGYAIALVMKSRLTDMAKDAATVTSAASQSPDLRTDWQVNNSARSLMLRALAAQKELTAARTNLESRQVIANTQSKSRFNFKRAAAIAITVASAIPDWGKKLGDLGNMTNKLASLVTAKQLAESYASSVAGHRETQAEYQQTLAAAQREQANVQALANSDGARKRVSSAALLQRANAIMQSMDTTVWDDPSKTTVARRAAEYAKSQLDRMVDGDVSGNWVSYLMNRAEAYKKEAYFRPINAEAQQWEKDDLASVTEFEQSVGFSIKSQADLDAQIAALQTEISALGKTLDDAPDAIKAQRDSIYKTTVAGTDYSGIPQP